MSWHGIFPSLPTPFTPDGVIDPVAQRHTVRFAVDRGAHGLVCFGLAGEVLKLTPDERKQLCDVIVEEANGAVPVLVGVGAESTAVARDLARHAEQAGVDGVVILPPTNATLTPDSLRDYFVAVAEAVSVPVMIQDASEYVGVALSPELVHEIARRVPHVRYLKLETAAHQLVPWVHALEGALEIFCGNGGLYILDCLRSGAAGIVPGLDLVDLLLAIYASEANGDAERAESLFRQFLPLAVFEMQDLDHYNSCAKYVLSRRGVPIGPYLRSPARSLAPEVLVLLDAYLEGLPLEEVAFVHRA